MTLCTFLCLPSLLIVGFDLSSLVFLVFLVLFGDAVHNLGEQYVKIRVFAAISFYYLVNSSRCQLLAITVVGVMETIGGRPSSSVGKVTSLYMP